MGGGSGVEEVLRRGGGDLAADTVTAVVTSIAKLFTKSDCSESQTDILRLRGTAVMHTHTHTDTSAHTD